MKFDKRWSLREEKLGFNRVPPKLKFQTCFGKNLKKLKGEGAQILNELGSCPSISIKRYVSDHEDDNTLKEPMWVFGLSAFWRTIY